MKKLLVICGPTATGKTSLSLQLAKVFNGELVSADSKQVYKRMDIGTGKDLPKNSKFQMSKSKLGFKNLDLGLYTVNGVKLWGYDLVDPKKKFSVAQYIKIARRIIDNIHKKEKLPVLVGGAGLYIKGVVDGITTADIKMNAKLRKSLEGKTTDDLYSLLANIDMEKAVKMNKSDRSNPRRLIRAIEVGSSKIKDYHPKTSGYDTLFIGLMADKQKLDKRIEERIDKRLGLGLEEEIGDLLKNGLSWESQAMQSLGYRQWRGYFGHKKGNTENTELTEDTERQKAIELWKNAEIRYAKRQMTWFKKDTRIKWFDISKAGWRKDIENTVYKWHNNSIKNLKSNIKM